MFTILKEKHGKVIFKLCVFNVNCAVSSAGKPCQPWVVPSLLKNMVSLLDQMLGIVMNVI